MVGVVVEVGVDVVVVVVVVVVASSPVEGADRPG